jgi:hypothetical protein
VVLHLVYQKVSHHQSILITAVDHLQALEVAVALVAVVADFNN